MDLNHKRHEKLHWRNKILFIISLIGSAVGLGNIWRFPYIVREEGFFFILLYLLFVFVIGLPALYIELFVGSHFRHSLTKLAHKVLKKYSFLVVIPFIVVIAISSYYTVISGWTLAFSILNIEFYSFKKSLFPLVFTLFVNLLAIFFVGRDIHKGIEFINKYFMTIFFFFLVVLFLFSAPWKYADMIFSSLERKVTIQTIISALSQALFSLSLGVGLLYTYSFFARPKGLFSSAFTTAVVDTTIALIAFLMINSFYFAFAVQTESPVEFSFVVMKDILSQFPYSSFLSFSFFFFLFIASFTSIISFYAFLKYNLPKEVSFLYYSPLIFSLIISIDWTLGVDLIYFIDRSIVEPLLPISLFITMYMFLKFYFSTKSQTFPSEKLPIKNNL